MAMAEVLERPAPAAANLFLGGHLDQPRSPTPRTRRSAAP
ncbi:RNA polymerase factor sigma-70, partial [Paraburkholderia sp. Se-20369]|nr:RNA polymerase factor sigma-70 [Paraburkholderia sp. Se-20369]